MSTQRSTTITDESVTIGTTPAKTTATATTGTTEGQVSFNVESTVTPSFWFFPNILGDGRSISISSSEAPNVEEAEQLARQKLEEDL